MCFIGIKAHRKKNKIYYYIKMKNRGGFMDKHSEAYWRLFEETGSVRVYIVFKKLYENEKKAINFE